MADLALLAAIATGIVVALHRDRHRPAPTRPGFRIDSIVIDETHEWADLDDLDAMRTAWSAHWNDLMPDRIEWEAVPLTTNDLAAAGFLVSNHQGPELIERHLVERHLVGETDIETMPEGCWRTINHPDGAYAPCNQPPASDLGLCATHLEELASQGASR